ncbi:thioesterase family protein [Streptomyces oceani]|uniref:4-hydroxybenzoyl-CoA thioesterase n=1 Tax=Streptomyces oceani TaxID=1075402 RepID=A0A1E7KNX2_9ACTN|nr:thioesterase family protein [Streptomyces oceani]OEV05598.1 4-hydroxybenzoyl-CoA thioesterase [Streptomyces oceani]
MTDGLPPHVERVRPAWIDYNGHLSEAYYVLVFGHATDAMMEATGLDGAYRAATGCSLYTVESHVRYLREVRDGAELRVRTRVLGVDAKRLRLAHEMYAEGGTEPVATTELLGLHVAASGVVPFPEEVRARYAALAEAPPAWAGRAIGPVPRG